MHSCTLMHAQQWCHTAVFFLFFFSSSITVSAVFLLVTLIWSCWVFNRETAENANNNSSGWVWMHRKHFGCWRISLLKVKVAWRLLFLWNVIKMAIKGNKQLQTHFFFSSVKCHSDKENLMNLQLTAQEAKSRSNSRWNQSKSNFLINCFQSIFLVKRLIQRVGTETGYRLCKHVFDMYIRKKHL